MEPIKTYTLGVPIPEHWMKALEQRAKAAERSLAAEVRLALRAHLTEAELKHAA
jgi:hypothetical protein